MNEIKRRLQISRDWLALIEELEAEAEQISDRAEKSRRLYVLGQACEELFLRKDRAMVNYQKAFKLLPQDVRPLERARQIYREMGNLKMVAKLLDFQLKVAGEPRDRARLLTDLALVYVDLLMVDEARQRFNEAQASDASYPALKDALGTVSYDGTVWREEVDQLRAEADTLAQDGAAQADAVDLLIRAVRIQRLQQEQPEAIEALLRHALQQLPQHDEANYLLELLLEQQGRTDDIRALHEARVADAPSEEQARLCRQFASWWAVRSSDLPTTALFYERALRSFYSNGVDPFPGHLAAFALLREIRGRDGAWSELLELAEQGLNAPLLEEDLAVLAIQAGDISWQELSDVERAAGFFEWAHRVDPDNPQVQDFREQHPEAFAAAGQENQEEVEQEGSAQEDAVAEEVEPAVAYEADAETRTASASEVDALVHETEVAEYEADAETRVAPEGEMESRARDGEEPASDAVHTIETEAVPADAAEGESPATEEVPAVVTAEMDSAAAADAAPVADEEQAAGDTTEAEAAAPTSEQQEAEPAAAPPPSAEELQEDIDPESAALFEQARQAEAQSPERGMAAWRKAAQKARQYRTPRRALAKLYLEAERWNQLVEVLKEEVELVQDPAERRALLLQMAEIYRDRLRLDVMVAKALNQALETFDGVTDDNRAEQLTIVDLLLSQHDRMKRWTDLITTLRRKAEIVPSVEEKVSTWTEVASLFFERFSNQAEAIKAYERVLELDPLNAQALSQLKAMYERRRDWDKLRQVCEREIDGLSSQEERASASIELARLMTAKLKRPHVSMELWARVIEFDPTNEEALQQLEALYERGKEWEKLADVCQRQVELGSDEAHKAQLLQKLGLLYADKLGREDAAMDAWQKLLEIDPDNRRAQDALKKLYLAAKAYDQLEAFYARQQKWEEFIRVLERQVDAEEPEQRVALYFKVAELWQQKLEKPERAVRAYEKVLTLDGQNQAAAEALIPLYQGGRDVAKYAQVLEIQLAYTEEPELKLERIRELARLYESDLRNADVAFDWLLRAFQTDPRADWTREEAERLAAETGKWVEIVSAYEAAYEGLAEPADRLPLLLTVARVYEQELANVDEALRTNQQILELEPQHPAALDALERLYGRTEQWTELLDVYLRKIELADDPEQRKEMYFKSARIYEDELEDSERAVNAYRTVLDLDADDKRALRSLTNIYQRQGRWSDLAETVLRELALVDAADVDATVELKYRLGQLNEHQLEDVPAAIECYRDILELRRDHDGARAALEQQLGSEAHQLEAVGILEPIYTELEAWPQLVQVCEIQLARQDDPVARVDLLQRIGALWVDRLGDGDKAFDAYSRCFKADPGNAEARRELERLADIQERVSDLAQLYEEATAEALDAPLQHGLLVKLAHMLDERLEDADRAVEVYQRALELEPDDSQTLDALEKLYTKREAWDELLGIYRRKVDISTDLDERLRLLGQMAYIWEEMLGNLPEAVICHSEILAQDDGNLEALKALERLYQVQGAWHELADNLSRQLAMTEDEDEVVDLLLRLASVRETELEEASAAVETYRQVLDRDPRNATAVNALERLVDHEDHQQAVAQILEPYYKATADWRKLVGVYEIMVKHALEPERRIELLHQIAELYEVAGEDPSNAFGVFGRALREGPDNAATQQSLERLARQLDNWQALVDLYTGLVSDMVDEGLAVSLYGKVAAVYEHQLSDLEQSAQAQRKILEIDPQNLEAVNALEQLFTRSESYEDLVDILLKKAEVVLDVPERKQLYFRAAQIREEVLEQTESAIAVYQSVLELDDTDAQALDALERLYLRLERWSDLKDVYARKSELTESADEKKQIFYRLGTLHEEQLEDQERAIETFQGILDLDPEDGDAISALQRLYRQTERWYDLLQVLERRVELAGSSPQAVDLRHQIGQLWQSDLADVTRAVETYREVLALDPTHEPTLQTMDGLLHGDAEPELAAQVLEPIYEQSLEWGRLVDVYEVMVKHSDDPFRRLELLHRIGDLREVKQDDSRGAFDAYGRALQDDSADEVALTNLERLAAEIDGWGDLAALYERELEKLLDPLRQTEMGLRVARVHEEELGAPDQAIAHYDRVLTADPDNAAATLALDRLYLASGQYEKLAEILRREIQLAETDEQIIELQFRLGQLFQDQLADTAAAIECYRDILATSPEHSGAVTALELLLDDGQQQLEIAEVLEPLYRMGEHWQKLVKIMEVQLAHTDDPLDKVSAVQRIAEICEQRLGDQVRAFQWYGQALEFDPTSELLTEELERLAGAADGWAELTGFYERVLPSVDDEDRRRLLMRVARVCDQELRDPARAEEAYLRVLQIDAEEQDALAALDRIYEQAAMHRELADILGRRAAVTDDTTTLIEIQLRLAMTYEAALEQLDAAVEVYNDVLEHESRNARALDALERIYFAREQWQELYEVYEKMVDIAPGDAGVADCYARMGKIASDALSDRERAQDLWTRVLDLRGEDPVALWALADLYEAAEEWRDLVEVLERQATIVDDGDSRVALYRRLGRIWGEKLDRDRNALEAWQKVLEIDPNDVPALFAIAAIHRNMQAWEELAETLRRLIDLAVMTDMPEEELRSLYAQLGELLGEILLRPEEAIEAWRKALELQPDDLRALAALELLLSQEARWEECIQVLERKAAVIEDVEQKIDVLMQAANIWQERVENDEAAAQVYEQLLALDQRNETAFVQLEQIYREGERWENLVDLLLARVELIEAPEDSVEMLQRVASIYEQKLESPEHAFEVLRAAFRSDYANDVTVKELERLASITNRWSELLSECQAIVQTVQDPQIRANMLVNMGLWYSELGHLDYAIPSVQQALQIDPESRRALDALGGFFRRTGQWAELVQTLNRTQEVEDNPEKRVAILAQMGEIYEDQLDDTAQAIGAYRKAHQIDDVDADVLDALERLHRRAQEWDGLISVLRRKAELCEDPDQIMELRGRIGQLFEDEVGDPARAVESYKDVLAMDPQQMSALRALERLYEKGGQTEEYLDVLEQQLDVAGSDEERASLYKRMAGVWEEQFEKLDRAAECLEKILLIDEGNVATYRDLERMYTADRRFEDLVDTYRRHINVIMDPQDRVELYLLMGKVYEESLRDSDRAIEAYTDILSFDPDQTEALDALARLFEQIESWDQAVDTMSRLVQLMDDVGYRVDVLYRLGRIFEQRLDDSATAEEKYSSALELDSTHAPSMTALVNIYKERGDWAKAAQMMVKAEQYTGNPLEKTKLLHEAGAAFLEHLHDEATATDMFARTLQIDPDHVEAGEPLAQIYFREGRYEEVEPVLEMLVRKTDRRDNRRLRQLHYQLAKTADELQKNDKALKHYRAAYDIDSTDLPTLRGMADLLHRMEDWDRAFKIYQTILVHHRDSQEPEQIVEIFYRLGNIKLKLGERKKALNMFEKALEIDPHHRHTLDAVIDLKSRQGEWDAVIDAKRALMSRASEDQRFELLNEIGSIYQEKQSNPEKAIDAYRDALDARPESHPVLHRLIELYSSTKQWKRAVEMILRICEMEPNARLRARYLYTAAVINRDEVRSLDEAVELFDRSLDETFREVDASSQIQPDQFKAFEALDRICTQKKDWKTQERHYRKMLKRLPQDGQQEWNVRLWHALGEIYRTRLRQYDSAIKAFEIATQLDAGNIQRHEILAELYVLSGPEHFDKAVKQHQVLIKAAPYRIESYKALRQIYMDTRQYDKAWCVCATLCFLKKADAEEQRFYEQYRQKGFVRARATMTDELWRKYVFHPEEDVYVGTILGVIAPVVGAMTAQAHKKFGLKKKERRDLANDKLLFSRVFHYVCSLLRVQEADLFLSERASGLYMAHTVERPSFVVGQDLLQGRPEKELGFAIGRQLSYLRPEHFLRNVLQASPSHLRTVFLAALRLCNPQFPVPPAEQAEIDKFLKEMRKKIHPSHLDQLSGIVKRFVERTSDVNLARWLSAVELTANRVGFITCNDLEVAAKMVSSEPATVGSLPPKERVKELVLYSVSEEYFVVRDQLGLTIAA